MLSPLPPQEPFRAVPQPHPRAGVGRHHGDHHRPSPGSWEQRGRVPGQPDLRVLWVSGRGTRSPSLCGPVSAFLCVSTRVCTSLPCDATSGPKHHSGHMCAASQLPPHASQGLGPSANRSESQETAPGSCPVTVGTTRSLGPHCGHLRNTGIVAPALSKHAGSSSGHLLA